MPTPKAFSLCFLEVYDRTERGLRAGRIYVQVEAMAVKDNGIQILFSLRVGLLSQVQGLANIYGFAVLEDSGPQTVFVVIQTECDFLF